MSHNIEYFTYPITKNPSAIEKELQTYAKHATREEGGGGLCRSIRWLDYVCDDYESAQDFVQKKDKGWYDQLAVKFKHFDKPLTSKRLDELKAQHCEAVHKLHDLENKVVFTDFKAQFITCKNCGSKLNKDYIKRNSCVVCGYDMRSDTAKNAITRLKEKIEKLTKAIAAEEKKLAETNAKKAKLYWLVKIEYHT